MELVDSVVGRIAMQGQEQTGQEEDEDAEEDYWV